MSKCPMYKDHGKKACDLLNDDYNFDRKLKVETKTGNGVTFTTEGAMKGEGKSILAKLSAKFKHSSGINVKKLQLTTAGRLIGEFDMQQDDIKFIIKAEDGNKGGKSKSVIGAQYQTDAVAVSAEVDAASGPAINATAAFGFDSFVVGGMVKYNTQFDDKANSPSLDDYNASLNYNGGDASVTLKTANKLDKLMLGVHHNISRDVQVASAFTYGRGDAKKSLTVGGQYALDSDTTLQGKINNDGIVSFNYIQQVKPNVKLAASAQVDAKNFDGDSHKLGLSLTLK